MFHFSEQFVFYASSKEWVKFQLLKVQEYCMKNYIHICKTITASHWTYFFQVHLMTLKLLSPFYNLQSSLDKILGECSEHSRGSVFIKANCVLCILKH